MVFVPNSFILVFTECTIKSISQVFLGICLSDYVVLDPFLSGIFIRMLIFTRSTCIGSLCEINPLSIVGIQIARRQPCLGKLSTCGTQFWVLLVTNSWVFALSGKFHGIFSFSYFVRVLQESMLPLHLLLTHWRIKILWLLHFCVIQVSLDDEEAWVLSRQVMVSFPTGNICNSFRPPLEHRKEKTQE